MSYSARVSYPAVKGFGCNFLPLSGLGLVATVLVLGHRWNNMVYCALRVVLRLARCSPVGSTFVACQEHNAVPSCLLLFVLRPLGLSQHKEELNAFLFTPVRPFV